MPPEAHTAPGGQPDGSSLQQVSHLVSPLQFSHSKTQHTKLNAIQCYSGQPDMAAILCLLGHLMSSNVLDLAQLQQ